MSESSATAKPLVRVLRSTADWMVAEHWVHVLERAGYACDSDHTGRPRDPAKKYDLVVLLGVGSDLSQAGAFVRGTEHEYPGAHILILSSHDNPANIDQFKGPHNTVLSKVVVEEHFLRTVATLVGQKPQA